jgi:hypothetical protein
VEWWVNSSASPSPYSDLSVVIRALRGALGGWGLRGLLSQVLVMLLYRRLGGICGQMERLSQRFQAGKLGRLTGRKRTLAVPAEAEERRRVGPRQVLPRRFGWLVWAASYHAAGYGSQLQAILGTPEMIALLTAAPQAGRILRPVCRMLAVDMSLLRPGTAGAAPEVAPEDVPVVVRKRVRAPRPRVDWGRIPLPRGVLSAARRQGFGKIR